EGDEPAYVSHSAPGFGSVTVVDGEITFLPEGNTGTTSFEVTVGDEDGVTVTITVTVVVNAAPTGNDIEAATDFEESVSIDVLGGVADPEGGDVSIAGVDTPPANGSVVVDGGSVVYTPADGFSG